MNALMKFGTNIPAVLKLCTRFSFYYAKSQMEFATYFPAVSNKAGFYPCSLCTSTMFPDQSASNINFRVIIHVP